MPEKGATSREVFAFAMIPIIRRFSRDGRGDQNPILRITKRGNIRIANMTSPQIPGA